MCYTIFYICTSLCFLCTYSYNPRQTSVSPPPAENTTILHTAHSKVVRCWQRYVFTHNYLSHVNALILSFMSINNTTCASEQNGVVTFYRLKGNKHPEVGNTIDTYDSMYNRLTDADQNLLIAKMWATSPCRTIHNLVQCHSIFIITKLWQN